MNWTLETLKNHDNWSNGDTIFSRESSDYGPSAFRVGGEMTRYQSADFSEEECFIILEEEDEDNACEITSTVKIYKEYQGEDFAQYLPEYMEVVSQLVRRCHNLETSKGIRKIKMHHTSAKSDTDHNTVTTSTLSQSICRQPLSLPPLDAGQRPSSSRQRLNHTGNNQHTRKNSPKTSNNRTRIQAFSFTDSNIGSLQTGTGCNCIGGDQVKRFFMGDPFKELVRLEQKALPPSRQTTAVGLAAPPRRSNHGSNFTLVSRRSLSRCDVTLTSDTNIPMSVSKKVNHHHLWQTSGAHLCKTLEPTSLWKKIFGVFQKSEKCRKRLISKASYDLPQPAQKPL